MADNENNTGSIQTVHGLSVEQSLLGAVNAAAGQEPDEEYETIPVDELERVKLGRQGENETQTVVIDCNDWLPDLETTAQEAAGALLTAIMGVLTDDAVQKIGKDLDEDIWTGVVLGEDELLTVVAAVAGDAYDELEQAVTDAKFDQIGEQLDNGVIDGINRGSANIAAAARAAAAAAYAAACAELQVNSPSKKGAYLGEMFDLGFAEGLMDNADEIEDAMGYLNGLAVADAEPVVGVSGGSTQASGFEMDYGAMRDAFAEAIEETGVGYSVIAMDAQIVGETVEPYSSRATAQRQKQSVKGRTARLVMG